MKIEEIYPLTIISPRYCVNNINIIIFNIECDNWFVQEIQLSDEPMYDLDNWLQTNIYPVCYGYGDNLESAFEMYQNNFKKK